MAPRVIKSGQIPAVKPAEFNPTDMLAETGKRVENARQEIERYQSAAQQQARTVLTDAQKQGFEAGYRDGLAKGQAEAQADHRRQVEQEVHRNLQTLLPALEQTVQKLQEARELWQGEWERLGIELACAIAARVVHHSIDDSSQTARRTLAKCLSLVGRCPRLTIYLHPNDVESLDLDRGSFDSIFQGIGDVRVLGDDSLTPGGCRVESEFGSIDAAIETQLDRIADELLGSADETE